MDLQLNISTGDSQKKSSKLTKSQGESSGYKIISKPVFSGKVLARKRNPNSDNSILKNVHKPSSQVSDSKTINYDSSNKKSSDDLSVKLKDLSQGKGKFKNKNFQDLSDDIRLKSKPRAGGWISSLFKNNPTVPKLGQRAVKPLHEEVFSGKHFSDLDIHSHCVANIEQNLGLKELMTVQKMASPIILQGRDVLIRSQTGSGKTLAYALPIIEGLQAIRPKLDRHGGIKVLVIVPTRELAVQTYELFIKLVKPFTWLVPGLLSGGQKRKAEKARLRKGLNILIGTPGRICDHLRHTASLNFNKTRCLVLDEADRLLDMGYEKDVAEIIKAIDQHKVNSTYNPLEMMKKAVHKNFEEKNDEYEANEEAPRNPTDDVVEIKHNITNVLLSNERQTILLSATLTKAVENLAGITTVDPVFVDTSEGKAPVVADSLKQIIDSAPGVKTTSKSAKEAEQKQDSDTELDKSQPKLKGLNQFDGSKLKVLFGQSSEKDMTGGVKSSASEDSDSDSDYEYFKVQKKLKKKIKTDTEEVVPEMNESDDIEVDSFQTAVKSAIEEDKIVLPSTVNQNFLITPMKLRLVTLSAAIIEHCVENKNGGKMIVFMATQEMVDYHSSLLETVLTDSGIKKKKKDKKKHKKAGAKKSEDEQESDEKSSSSSEEDLPSDFELPLPGEPGLEGIIPVSLEFYKLFGSMPHEERIEVFKSFRKAKAGVLFCTDVAARGLDLPRVDLVFQYNAPTSVTDYVHRVGRTGRAASVGAAILLLLPSESDFVRLLEEKKIRLKQMDDKECLESLRMIVPTANSASRAAICIQARIEKTVHKNKEWLKRASRAYTSWVRFYAGYPRAVREYLDNRSLHLGHAAKSFGLRDTPGAVSRRVKNDADTDRFNQTTKNRLTVDKEMDAKRPGIPKMKLGGKRPVNKQASMHTASEFDSGIEPASKKNKKK